MGFEKGKLISEHSKQICGVTKFYWNSGVMLLRPSMAIFAKLIHKMLTGSGYRAHYQDKPFQGLRSWTSGFGACRQLREIVTEQDLLISSSSLFGRILWMDVCANFRGY